MRMQLMKDDLGTFFDNFLSKYGAQIYKHILSEKLDEKVKVAEERYNQETTNLTYHNSEDVSIEKRAKSVLVNETKKAERMILSSQLGGVTVTINHKSGGFNELCGEWQVGGFGVPEATGGGWIIDTQSGEAKFNITHDPSNSGAVVTFEEASAIMSLVGKYRDDIYTDVDYFIKQNIIAELTNGNIHPIILVGAVNGTAHHEIKILANGATKDVSSEEAKTAMKHWFSIKDEQSRDSSLASSEIFQLIEAIEYECLDN